MSYELLLDEVIEKYVQLIQAGDEISFTIGLISFTIGLIFFTIGL